MVSTRQMSIVNNGECSSSAQVGEQSGASCRATRNATSSALVAAAASAEPGPSTSRFLPPRQAIFLLDLPVEVVEKILSYLTFKNVCQLRLVSIFFQVECCLIYKYFRAFCFLGPLVFLRLDFAASWFVSNFRNFYQTKTFSSFCGFCLQFKLGKSFSVLHYNENLKVLT